MRIIIATITILLLPMFASASNWMIDTDNSSVRFKVNNLMFSSVSGKFHKFSGMVNLHDKDVTKSRLSVAIDMASVDTDTLDFKEDLRSDRYLDVARYPTMIFTSKKIVKNGTGTLKVTGDLTLHGVTREVILNVTGPSTISKDLRGRMKRNASATARISRKEFGLTWDELLTIGLDDIIDINIEIVFVMQR